MEGNTKLVVEAKMEPVPDVMDQDVHISMPFSHAKALVALLGPNSEQGLVNTTREGSKERVYLESLISTKHDGWAYRIYSSLHDLVRQHGGFKN